MKSSTYPKRLPVLPMGYGPLLAILVAVLPVGLRAQTIQAAGSLDSTYKNPATDQAVNVVIAQLVNGATKAIIGGSFSSLLDNSSTPVPGFARFNADGSLDTAFLANVNGTTLGDVTALALQPDGKLLVAGHAGSLNTGGNSVLLRFGADGTPDTAFRVTLDNDVESIAFQADSSILISGFFTKVNGTGGQRRLARLSPAGVLDNSFQAYTNNALTITEVKRIAVLPGGGLVAVTHVSEGNVDYLVQLDATDGSVPNAPTFFHLANDGRIYDMSVDATGRVVVVGNFDGIDGHPRASHVARFGADGQIDTNFIGNEVLPSVLLQSVVVDTTGRPLVGGVTFFTPALFRLTADTGAIDSTFSFPLGNEGNYIQGLALEPATNGAILAAGQFSVGQRAANLLRVIIGTTGGGTGTTSNSVSVSVPGTSNLWLAGAAAGTTASTGQDNLTNATPFRVAGLTITPGNTLTFIATDSVSNDPAFPAKDSPDGDSAASHLVENGISSLVAPYNSLIGVYLDDTTPSGTPPDGLNFTGLGTPVAGTSYTTLTPALRQPFFVGDGKDASGNAQGIVVPAGATRLFLGSLDPSDQENNLGAFSVAVTNGTTTTPPASGPVLVVNSDDFAYSFKGQPNTGTVVPGDVITYSLTVRNTGTAPANTVVVRASFDANQTKFKSADHVYTQSGNVVTWTVPTIANGDHVVLTYSVKVKNGVDTQSGITIGASVQSATAAAPAVALSIKNLPGVTLRIVPLFNISTSNDGVTARPGGPLTFTFTVVNRGTSAVLDVTVDVHLPNGYVPANFKIATFIDDNGNPVGSPFKLGAQLDNGQIDPESVRLSIDNLPAGASRRFIVTVNVPYDAAPGSKVTLPSVALNGEIYGGGEIGFTQGSYTATLSNQPALSAPSLTVLKLSPTASNLQAFLSAASNPSIDKKSYLAKSAQQFFLALTLYTGQSPDVLEAMTPDQLALLLNPYVSRDTDPDSGSSLFDVPSPNAKQPSPAVTYLLLYFNTGAGDAAGITITDRIPAKLALDPASISIKGLADVKTNTVGADGSLTFTFGKVKSGTGGLIVYKAKVPAPSFGGPALGDIVNPTTVVLTTASLSSQSFYTPAENLLITGPANAFVESSQADVGDGTTNYTIYYKNTGGKKSNDFTVVSMVPTGGAFVSADLLDIGQSVRAADSTKGEHIDTVAVGATSGRVAFHLGKVKPRGLGLVRVTYKVTDAALALKPAGLVHHYYVAGGSFPDAASAMRNDRPVPRWARRDEETRLTRQGGNPRFGPGDIIGVFKQGFDNVTHAVGSLFAKPGTPQPPLVAPTIWGQRIAPLSVQENTDFTYVVTIGNSGATPAYLLDLVLHVPQGATFVSGNGGTYLPATGLVDFQLTSLQPGTSQTITLTFHATAKTGPTIVSSDCYVAGYGSSDYGSATGIVHVGSTSSLVYSVDQARNFPALQTAIATNAAQAGGIDPSALASNPKFAVHAAAITPNSTQTAIAHADYYTTTNGLTLVAQGGGNLVAQGGGNVLASGPSNLVAQGGGNLVAQGGGNLVAQGGGNLTFNNIPGFGATVTASALLSENGVAKLVAQGGGNLVAQGGGNLVAQGGGNIFDLSGTSFATSTLINVNTLVAGQGNQQSLGLVSDGGSGVISNDGGSLISNDGGGLKFVGGASALISNDGGGFHRTSAVGGKPIHTQASTVKAGTLLGSPINSVSLDFNSAGGMIFGVGGSRANGQ